MPPKIEMYEAEQRALRLAEERDGITIRALIKAIPEYTPDENCVLLGLLHKAGYVAPSGTRRRRARLFLLTTEGRGYLDSC